MAKAYAKKFYNSKEWKMCRANYIKSTKGGLCEQCIKNNKYTPGYIVDHKEELTPENINDHEITLNHNNLQYLCLECHNIKTFGTKEDVIREGLMFDEKGNLIEIVEGGE